MVVEVRLISKLLFFFIEFAMLVDPEGLPPPQDDDNNNEGDDL